jgi:hypothetical protein
VRQRNETEVRGKMMKRMTGVGGGSPNKKKKMQTVD